VRGGMRGPLPCLRHARPRHVRPAQPPGSQGRGSRWCGDAPRSLQKHSRLDDRHSQRHIAQRRRAQEHEEPRSSDLSRGGSSAARWPAHRQGKIPDGAPLHRRYYTGKHPRRERIRSWPRGAHVGRRCSRGRLGGVALGVGVPTLPWPSRPARHLPSPTATGPVPLGHKRSSVFSSRRGGGATHSSPSPPRSVEEQKIGENHNWSVGSPQGFGLRVKAPVKATRGQN
jgi:hypothetical protein